MTALNEYIKRIENQDATLTSIGLRSTELNTTDAERLMQALRNSPEIANHIRTLDLCDNQLTSIDIPATLIALQDLYLQGNQLTSIDIPATLIALQRLSINNNQLSSIDIPATLTALYQLYLDNNQLTSLNIPATLTALRLMYLEYNQLTSINISAELIALHTLHLKNNQLTAATKLALSAFNIKMPALYIIIGENIPGQLTPEIFQEHFETMRPVFLANMQSRKFKNAVINATVIKSKPVKSKSEGALPIDLILMALDAEGVGLVLTDELDKNITMFKNAFANDEQQLNVLNQWLNTLYVGYKQDIRSIQRAEVESLSNEFKSNMMKVVKNFFIGKQDLLRTTYFEEQESNNFGSELLYNIEKTHLVNSIISRILSIQEQYPELALERDVQHLMFGHPDFAKGDPLVKMVENVKNGEPGLNFNFLTPIAKRALAWQNALSYGLIVTDSTSVDPTQNPFQLALRSRI
jgi:hypothetical protein